MKALGPILMILVVYAIVMTWLAISLWYRIRNSKDPLQVLSRRRRRAYAEELLERRQQEYDDARFERLAEQIKAYPLVDRPTHKKESA